MHFRFVILCLAVCALLPITGCDDDAASTAGGTAAAVAGPQPGHAVGKVTMADGKPITLPEADISFSISGVGMASENLSYTPIVKPDGSYKQKLAPGGFRSQGGSVEFQYEGERFKLPLEPVGPNWNRSQESGEGIVQDYVLKTTGERPRGDKDVNNRHNWYGLTVALSWTSWLQDVGKAPPTIPDKAKLIFTLKPTVEKTIDGQPAKTITLERAFDATWKMAPALHDQPIAHYELTGECVMPDGARKRVMFCPSYAKYTPSIALKATPDMVTLGAYVNTVWFHTEE